METSTFVNLHDKESGRSVLINIDTVRRITADQGGGARVSFTETDHILVRESPGQVLRSRFLALPAALETGAAWQAS